MAKIPTDDDREHLVLLPGMMCDQRQWRPQIDALRPYCASISVADTTRSDTLEGIARTVLADAPERFALAGLSMGGLLAFEIWRQAPERVNRLALLNANARQEDDARRAARQALLARVLRGELREVVVDSLKPGYLAASHRQDRELLRLILAMAMDLGDEAFVRQSRAVGGRADSVATLPTISVPTLVLCGQEDRICPVGFHELMHERIANSRLAVLENCGHLSTLERPDRVNEEFVRWLKVREPGEALWN